MNNVSRIIGEMTSASGVPAVDGPPIGVASSKRFSFRRRKPAGNAGKVIGEDGNDEPIIPKDAREIELEVEVGSPNQSTQDNSSDNDPGDLINPSSALVAPDVTPDAMKPIDPSMVPPPKQDPAISVVLGQQPQTPASATPVPAPQPSAPAPAVITPQNPVESINWRSMVGKSVSESAPASLPGIPTIASLGESQSAIPTGDAALNANAPMPAPVQAQPGKVIDAFRRFVG